MVYDAEQCARNAEADTRNDYGMCLQQTRIWCGIGSYYPDATTAWKNTNHRHPASGSDGRHPPRGAPVYWTGGSHGYGHIALSLGGGKIRSTDAGGSGQVATVDLGWVESHWGLPYAGWAEDINETTIPGIGDSSDSNDREIPEEDDVSAKDVWAEQFAKWAPDATQNEGKKIDAAQQLNQARGYAEDAYDRIKAVENRQAKMDDKLDQILKKLG